ncbi:hypothetical protein, partial [Francisella tularensis]|uniref:hypothetical protein n=1 Tax=Francisella tularensis TaxID=263 RepID=UPI003C6D0259
IASSSTASLSDSASHRAIIEFLRLSRNLIFARYSLVSTTALFSPLSKLSNHFLRYDIDHPN